ncbi:complex I intermediate-associated protein [Biscogniauxia mediterranea]|nr:complex I intermediate-associated protein [Biscogniauxia mediterranea]
MRAQLTRHVSRRLLANRALAVLPICPSLARPAFRAYPLVCRVARVNQRRAFFQLFQKPPRVLKEVESEPGYETFLRYSAAARNHTRPPLVSELVAAWREFFGYKAKNGRVVNSTQADCALRVLLYLHRSEGSEGSQGSEGSEGSEGTDNAQLSADDLRLARDCLSKPPRDSVDKHLKLSRLLYREIRRKVLGIQARPFHDVKWEVQRKTMEAPGYAKDFYPLLSALAQFGQAIEAKEMLLEYWRNLEDSKLATNRSLHLWMPVIRGLAREGHQKELLNIVSQAQKSGLEFDPSMHGVVSTFFAQQNNVSQTKHWFQKSISNELPPAPATYYEILKFALRNDQKEWAEGIFQNLLSRLESGPLRGHKSCWDTAFQWAVLLHGKGNEHLEHMFQVAYEQTKNTPSSQPNIGSINGLLKVAIEKKDPYMAERFVSLSKKLGFTPNFKTYILQIEYRMLANDLDGAYRAFQALQNQEETYKDREVPILNHFIRALCEATKPNYERVLEVTSYLEQRHVTLEPETVAAICLAFLKNDETFEVMDTLSLHTLHYSIDERRMVCRTFVDYCLDDNNSTARVWDAYTLLRQFFPELEVEDRLLIMDAFFDRRRSDMACHVFSHMRSHPNQSYHPNERIYVHALQGIGRSPDPDSLRMIHNMLKMDTTIQPNTLLYNGLMIAYIACGAPHRALEYWEEITRSPEGPSYATLELVFRAYQITSRGDGPTRELWQKIRKLDIEVPVDVYVAYVTSLAAHSHIEDVKDLLDKMEEEVGAQPNARTLAYIINAFRLRHLRDEFEEWAKQDYRAAWEKMKHQFRRRKADIGAPRYMIMRPWKA